MAEAAKVRSAMPACAIRYRRNSSGPAAYLVEFNGRLHIYTNGVLGAALPESLTVTASVARDFGWVPVKDDLVVDVPIKGRRLAEARREAPLASERTAAMPAPVNWGEIGEAYFA
jgi:hypothetical protein